MLSAHEIAALLVLASRGSAAGLDPVDIDTLANKRLVDVPQGRPIGNAVLLTHEGRKILVAVETAKIRAGHPWTERQSR